MSKTSGRNFPRNNSHSNNNHNNGSGKYRSNDRKPGLRHANPYQSLQKAKQLREKYLTLAREALASGDPVEAEGYFQHADHYTRLINELLRERYIMEQENLANVADSREMGNGPPRYEGNYNNNYPQEERNAAVEPVKPHYQRYNRNPQEYFVEEEV